MDGKAEAIVHDKAAKWVRRPRLLLSFILPVIHVMHAKSHAYFLQDAEAESHSPDFAVGLPN